MNNKTFISTALAVGIITVGGFIFNNSSVPTNANETLTQSFLEAKKYVFGIYEGSHKEEYDINNDGNLNVLDILEIKRDALKEVPTETTITTTPIQTTTSQTTTTTIETTTTTIETTSPIETTTPPTTQTLPRKSYISGVTPIVQSGLPTGCEATGLTIALNWYGFNVTKEEMALTYMPRQDFYYANGRKIGPDFMLTFAGDPTRASSSYGCYIPCMTKTVQNYFDDIGETTCSTTDLTGTTLDDLFKYVANGTPVILISTNNLITPTTGASWYTADGRYLTWQKGHHCMVLTGYDYDKNVVYVSESAYSYERTYDMDKFRSIYNQKGKYAMIINVPEGYNPNGSQSSINDTYVTPFSSGDICTIKNVGSGKYLNVDYGYDVNETNVYQWTGDGSIEQTFKMDFLSEGSCYRIRAMCSSNGTDKTLDIVKSNGNVVSGCNVEIYSAVDNIAQQWLFVKISDNTYKIVPKYNKNLALTAYGDLNGSGSGTSTLSAGNVFVYNYKGTDYQKWVITKIN